MITTLRWSVPYILSGIASAIAIRAGIFNMGLKGCIYLGGLTAGLLGMNEVIMTWMLSYIAVLLCQFFAAEVFQKPEDVTSAVQQVRTSEITETAKLSQLIPPYQLNTSL